MFIHIPDHFSSKFKFNLRKIPTRSIDRSSIAMVIGGWIFGIMLLSLGIYELLIFLGMDNPNTKSFIIRELSSVIIVFIALGIMISSTLSFIRYKKFYFDGKNFHVTYRPSIGVKHSFVEPLKNYTGVRLRILFKQVGLFNKNRYIIDLYHNDTNKVVPLYISTSNKGIRKIWEDYAKLFKMPAISVSERGIIQRDWQDLNKSVKELSVAKKLPFISSGKSPVPDSIDLESSKSETVIKTRRINWDIFSVFHMFLIVCAILALISSGIYLVVAKITVSHIVWEVGAFLMLVLLGLCAKLLYSYELHILNDRIIIDKTIFGKNISKKIIFNDAIKSVELSYNPTIARYDISIICDDDITNLKNRLPVLDLLWLKDFILRKLINN